MTRSLPLVTSSEPGPVLVAAAKFPSSLAPRWDRRDGGGAGSSREYRAAAAADPRPSPHNRSRTAPAGGITEDDASIAREYAARLR